MTTLARSLARLVASKRPSTLQNSPGSETLGAVDPVSCTGENILDLGEDGIQGFNSTPDSAEVG